jgi:putative oxidoreductase
MNLKTEAALTDFGLLFLRLTGSLLLMYVHGLPKLLHYSVELTKIEDPFGLGGVPTLAMAIFAEVVCPIAIILGIFTRLACLPILAVLAVAMFIVHPEWSIADGQFGWMLIIIFGTIFIAGPGRYRLMAPMALRRS